MMAERQSGTSTFDRGTLVGFEWAAVPLAVLDVSEAAAALEALGHDGPAVSTALLRTRVRMMNDAMRRLEARTEVPLASMLAETPSLASAIARGLVARRREILAEAQVVGPDEREHVLELALCVPGPRERPRWEAAVLTLSDVSDRVRAEQERLAVQQRNEALLSAFPDCILLVDREGLLVGRASPCRLNAGGARPQYLTDLVPGSQRELCGELLATIFATGEPALFEYHDSHTGRNMEARLSAVDSESAVVILRNVSERTRVERELRAAIEQREMWLREVHYRVKTNLQIISSLVYLGSHSVDGDVRQLVSRTQRRIRSMALIHENLCKSLETLKVDFEHYLRDLVGELPGVRAGTTEPGRVTIHIACDDVQLPLDVAVPCGLIIDELLHNALEHAFPTGAFDEGTPPAVWLELKDSGRELCLTIRDNGVGLPKALNPLRSDTLGLRLVRTLTYQLGGVLEIEDGPPTCIRAHIPAEMVRTPTDLRSES